MCLYLIPIQHNWAYYSNLSLGCYLTFLSLSFFYGNNNYSLEFGEGMVNCKNGRLFKKRNFPSTESTRIPGDLHWPVGPLQR